MSLDLAAPYEAARRGLGAFELARDLVEVAGPQAEDYLQGQLSQDVAALAPAASALSFLLEPQGKIVALLRVTRRDGETFVLDTDAGFGAPVIERLGRFKMRTKVRIERLEWRGVGLRGPDAPAAREAEGDGEHLVIPVDWPGFTGVDIFGPIVEMPAAAARIDAVVEALRIEAGVPGMGTEITERTIPEETGMVALAVSFTKGCYTGQELVARVDSRGGNVPRRLRGVVIEGTPPPPGAALTVDGKAVGEITSSAPRPSRAAEAVALAAVRRGNEPPLDATVNWEGGMAVARIAALPLVS